MSLAVIGGSGLYDLAELSARRERRVMTAWGEPSAAVVSGRLGGHEVMFLARHGAGHRFPPHKVNYRANVAALQALGATAIVGTAAVGGIGPATGAIVVPHDLIDYTWGREHTYSDGSQATPQHVDFTAPYAPALRAALLAAAAHAQIAVIDGGVYGATQGPRLESAAEVDRLERDGCTLVGMTGMPEAGLARELGIDYANISLVVNAAAGRADGPITMAEIERELAGGMNRIRAIIAALAAGWNACTR
ncbi:MAG: S-methyl-5'-thioinosine phosphorylase [Gammaproteobacteria bacterium]|nr:S-methyl-5'-thioinosine phosphorylase [Gammaproteobacteria bacterium]MCP5201590.1 S-methyl-5'-thioinosine phosphorylase [Gammaproteobacteria bacterium]